MKCVLHKQSYLKNDTGDGVVNPMKTMPLYIRILERCWASSGVQDRTTSTSWQHSKPERDKENLTKRNQAQTKEAIHRIRQIHHLERRLFL
jgi:hypothetical protein